MIRGISLILFLSLSLSAADNEPSAADAKADRHNTKGWDIRSWKNDKGEWVFSILFGTNRLKSVDEIRESGVVGIDALKKELRTLKEGEYVNWTHTAVQIDGKMDLEYPPADIIDEVRKFAEERKLKFEAAARTQDRK